MAWGQSVLSVSGRAGNNWHYTTGLRGLGARTPAQLEQAFADEGKWCNPLFDEDFGSRPSRHP